MSINYANIQCCGCLIFSVRFTPGQSGFFIVSRWCWCLIKADLVQAVESGSGLVAWKRLGNALRLVSDMHYYMASLYCALHNLTFTRGTISLEEEEEKRYHLHCTLKKRKQTRLHQQMIHKGRRKSRSPIVATRDFNNQTSQSKHLKEAEWKAQSLPRFAPPLCSFPCGPNQYSNLWGLDCFGA